MGWNHQLVILCPGGLSYGLRATRQSYTAAAQAADQLTLFWGKMNLWKMEENRSLRKKWFFGGDEKTNTCQCFLMWEVFI